MKINIIGSISFVEKISEQAPNYSLTIDKASKVVLIERGYDLVDDKTCIVFDPIEYIDVLTFISQDKIATDQTEQITGFSNNKYTIINRNDIYIIESNSGKLICFTKEEQYEIKGTLYYYEELLGRLGIIRINKSQLVNMYNVKEIIPWFNSRLVLGMFNGTEVEVSKLYSKLLRKTLDL